jgi:hypothetical protein
MIDVIMAASLVGGIIGMFWLVLVYVPRIKPAKDED